MLDIYVDADGCPVKQEVYTVMAADMIQRLSERHGLHRRHSPPALRWYREAVATFDQAVFAANDPRALAAVMRGFGSVAALAADELPMNEVSTLALIGDRDALIRDGRKVKLFWPGPTCCAYPALLSGFRHTGSSDCRSGGRT